MNNTDRQAIDHLFGNIAEVEKTTGPIDQQADQLIREKIAAQPAAPYLMAQTIVMQEQALNAAQERIAQLEQQTARSSGGLFSGLFGGGSPARQSPPARPNPMGRPPVQQQEPSQSGGPWGQRRGGGGGFLAGAAQTAMGVAGGVLLGNAIAGMLSGDEAQAEEPANAEEDYGLDDSFGDTE